jgi:SnoaL-like protein
MRPKLILVAGALLMAVSIAVPLHAQRDSQSSSKPVALTPQDYLDIQQLVAEYAWAIDHCTNNGYSYADLFVPDGWLRLPGTDRSLQVRGGATSWRRRHSRPTRNSFRVDRSPPIVDDSMLGQLSNTR